MKRTHHSCLSLLATFGLSAASLQAQVSITWDGSTSGNWNTSANWDLTRVPNTFDTVVFPAAGTNKAMNNDRPANTVFAKLNFTGSGYSLTGNSLTLNDTTAAGTSVQVTHTSGATTLNLPIVLGEQTSVTTAAGSTLTLNAAADISLGANALILSSGNLIDVNSTISGTGGVTVKGAGTVRFDAAQTYTGGTTIADSATLSAELILTSTMAGNVVVSTGGTLRGTGTIAGNVDVVEDIDPGDTGTGRLTINGNLTFSSVATTDAASFDLRGITAATSYDQLRVGGTVTANTAKITLVPNQAFPVGTVFVLIDKTSAGAISNNPVFLYADGTTIAEGSVKVVGVNAFQFSYVGGDGNDFTATVVAAPVGTTRNWDGGDVDDLLWSSAGNWASDAVPTAGQVLNFGAVATTDVATINDIGGNFGRIDFTGTVGGFTIAPQSLTNFDLTLTNGIFASQGGATCSVNNDLVIASNQTFSVTGSAGLTIGSGTSAQLDGADLTLHCAPASGTPSLAMNAGISGTGNLTKTGPGLVTLGGVGTSSNSYTGTTTVSEGELRLNRSTITAPANVIPGALIIGGGANPASVTTTVTEKIADTATVTVNTNGSFLPGANESIGAMIINGGIVNAGVKTLTLAGDLTSNTTVTLTAGALNFTGSRNISPAVGSTLTLDASLGTTVTKTGLGTLVLQKDSSAGMTITAGTVQVYDGIFLPNVFTLQAGGTLVGEASFGTINAAAGGTLMTDEAADTTCDSFTGGATAVFRPNLDAGTLLRMTTSAINLANTKLDPVRSTVPAVGSQFMILQNTSAAAITSHFTSPTGTVLNEGATFTTPFAVYKISYVGGTGNDVVLTTQLPTVTGVTRIWDGGGGGDTAWMTATNWVGDTLPLPGDNLEFPAAHVSSINNFPVGIIFGSISFTGAPTTTARSISGNGIQLLGNLSSSLNDNATRVVDVSLPITFLGVATVSNTGQRILRFNAAVLVNAASLTFGGDGSATQRIIRFLTPGLISGAGKIIVNGNASADLGSSLNHTYTGGTEVRFGQIIGSAATIYPNGLTVGDGVNTAAAFTGSTGTSASSIIVNAKGTLNAAGMNVTSLTLNGTAGNPAVVNATNVNLTTGFTAETGDSATFTSLTTPTLTQNGGTLTISGGATVSGEIRLQSGSLSLPSGSSAGRLQVDAGTLTQLGTLTVGADVQVNGGTLTGGGIDFTGSGTHAFLVETAATLQTLGDAAFTDQVNKTGSGALAVTTTLQAGTVTVTSGSFRNDATNIDLNSPNRTVVVLNGGHLQGGGIVGNIGTTAAPGSQISPGSSPGRLSASGLVVGTGQALQLNYEVTTVVPGSGHDQILIGGSTPLVSLNAGGNATLQLNFSPTFTAPIGTELVLIDQQGTTPISGTFVGKPQGFVETVGGISLRYSYTGGTGNDFTITLLTAPPAGEFRVWDGGGADANWMTAANWVGDLAPLPGDSLRFPNGALQLANNNNFPANTAFGTIKIEANYTLTGNSLDLNGNIDIQSPGTTTLSLPLSLDESHSLIQTGAGNLIRSGTTTLADNVKLTIRNNSTGEIDLTGTILPLGLADAGVVLDGTGLVKFNAAIGNSYNGETWVQRGVLQLSGNSVAEVPADLRIGGAGFLASVENPAGTVNGRINNASSLIMEVGGTHILTGSAPVERITRLVMRGGALAQPSGGQLIVLDRIEAEGNTASTIVTPVFFDASSANDIDVIHVAAGSNLTLAANSGFLFSGSFNPKVRKDGPGVLIMQASLTVTELDCWDGTLLVPQGGLINGTTILNGGTVTGNGSLFGLVKGVSAGTPVGSPGGGTLGASGVNGTGTGRLECGGNLQLVSSTRVAVKIGGTTAISQHDQIQVNGGALELNRCALDLSLLNNFVPTVGQTFTILNKISGGSPTGTPFAGKDEGATFTAAGQLWKITYLGGDGNDIVLTAQGPAATLGITTFTLTPPAGGAAGQQIVATLSGPASTLLSLQASSDLGNADPWQTIATATTNSLGVATFNFTDSAATTARRFYRFTAP